MTAHCIVRIGTRFGEHDRFIEYIRNIFIERIIEFIAAVCIDTENFERRAQGFYQFQILRIAVDYTDGTIGIDLFTDFHSFFKDAVQIARFERVLFSHRKIFDLRR